MWIFSNSGYSLIPGPLSASSVCEQGQVTSFFWGKTWPWTGLCFTFAQLLFGGQQNCCYCQQESTVPTPNLLPTLPFTLAELSPSCVPLRCTHTPQTPALSHEGRNELLVAEGTMTCCCFFSGLLLGDRRASTLGQVSCGFACLPWC